MEFNRTHVNGFDELVGKYGQDELASPRRSTVPSLAFWSRAESRFRELAAQFGLDPFDPVEFCFEFPVPVQQGRGKDSFTDLMILSPLLCSCDRGQVQGAPL